MNRINWTAIVALSILGLVVLLVAGSRLSFNLGGSQSARGWAHEGGWGMMGPGMMGSWGFGSVGWLFWLIGLFVPVGILALLIAGAVWFFRQIIPAEGRDPGVTSNLTIQSCSACGQPAQAEWRLCPYCGESLAKPDGLVSETA